MLQTFTALAVLLSPALLRADAPKGDKDLEYEWEVVSTFRDGKDQSRKISVRSIMFSGWGCCRSAGQRPTFPLSLPTRLRPH